MTDIVDSKTRSRMMSRIRGRDTKIEVRVRKSLWRQGFRYRLPRTRGYKGLPGIPDIVFPQHRAVILTNSCFFHGHGCHLFRLPEQNRPFWKAKIEANRERDSAFAEVRRGMGWKTLVVWECSLRGKTRRPFEDVLCEIRKWLLSGDQDIEIAGEIK